MNLKLTPSCSFVPLFGWYFEFVGLSRASRSVCIIVVLTEPRRAVRAA